MLKAKIMFFYSFKVSPEHEEGFVEYMQKFGIPVMSRYCKNWQLFKLNKALRGVGVPEYIGFFEIPDLETFFSSEPPEEMKETMKQAEKVCSDIREWIAEQIVSNI